MFPRGQLWGLVQAATRRGLQSGALRPIPTSFQFLADGGVEFLVRVIDQLAVKPKSFPAGNGGPPPSNPFLPYEEALHVADASSTHVCLLNKFNVVDHHLLIVTRQFEEQQSPLNLQDFTALWRCLAEYDSLGFYNAGTIAGASQPHKHLQLVPLPLVPRGPAIPIQPLIDSASMTEELGAASSIPFPHALAKFDPHLVGSPGKAARVTLKHYQHGARRLGFAGAPGAVCRPYNMLLTRRWLLLVPRSRESFHDISINALGFAGALLVRDERQLKTLDRQGPMAAVQHVSQP